MKQSKKGLAAVLAGIGVLCLVAAAAFGIHLWQENKRSQEALDALRDAAEDLKNSSAYPGGSTPDGADSSADSDGSGSSIASGGAGSSTGSDATGSSSDPNGAGSSIASGGADNSNASGGTDSSTDPDGTGGSIRPVQISPTPSAAPTASPAPTPEPTAVPVVNPYRDSFLANSDMAAWIQIPDTVIDYPVMWTPRDEEYYLYRDFNGRDNKNGCLILDTDSSLDPLTTNLIIHGHNMKSGEMFGRLTDYEDPGYYEDHKNIILYTEGVERNYEVISVFRSQVYKKTDQVFKFYKFFQADTEEEFDDFYQNIKKMSIYDTNVTAEFGDHFLTLSTCVYHVEQGRFVVVAKEVECGDSYAPIRE